MRTHLLTALAVLVLAAPASAQEAKAKTVLQGLHNPCGVAIQPGTGHVFVADSGSARVLRVVDGEPHEVIIGFPVDVYGKGPMYAIGPLGLAFLDENTLVVGGGGYADGEELLRVYTVPKAGEPPIKADAMRESFALAGNDEMKGEGNFYALAVHENHIYVTCNGDDTKGWVSRATVKDGKIVEYKRFLATKEATEVDAPVGIALGPQGQIVVGQMGEITIPGDGLVTVYSPSGEMVRNYETSLSDITALAFAKDYSVLYATDFSWADTSQGALYSLRQENGGSRTKLMSLDKPTAMAVAADGSLYVTVIGSMKKGMATGGALLHIKP